MKNAVRLNSAGEFDAEAIPDIPCHDTAYPSHRAQIEAHGFTLLRRVIHFPHQAGARQVSDNRPFGVRTANTDIGIHEQRRTTIAPSGAVTQFGALMVCALV